MKDFSQNLNNENFVLVGNIYIYIYDVTMGYLEKKLIGKIF